MFEVDCGVAVVVDQLVRGVFEQCDRGWVDEAYFVACVDEVDGVGDVV